MSLASLLNQPLTIERRSTTGMDAYGNEVTGITATEETEGYVEQRDATEITIGRETYTTDWLVVLKPGTAIAGRDRILYGSHVLEVVGQPHRTWNPRERAEGQVECRCREVQ